MSFIEREDVMTMMSGFVSLLWTELFQYDIGTLPRITYADSMERYGIDRPDNRYGLELHDISAIAAKTDFVVFKEALEKSRMGRGGVVKAIRVPTPNEKITRKLLDGYSDFAKIFKCIQDYSYNGPFILQAFRDDEGLEIFKTQLTWLRARLEVEDRNLG